MQVGEIGPGGHAMVTLAASEWSLRKVRSARKVSEQGPRALMEGNGKAGQLSHASSTVLTDRLVCVFHYYRSWRSTALCGLLMMLSPLMATSTSPSRTTDLVHA